MLPFNEQARIAQKKELARRLKAAADARTEQRFSADAAPTVATSACSACEHRNFGTTTCKAFEAGIPLGFLAGAYLHTSPYPGDQGVLFKQRKDVALKFDPEQPRDEQGRWTDSGSTASGGVPAPANWNADRVPGRLPDPGPGKQLPWTAPISPVTAERLRHLNLEGDPIKGEAAHAVLGEYKDTQAIYSTVINGTRYYSQGRLERHDAVISRFLANATPVDQPTALFLSGGTGSGKSSTIEQLGFTKNGTYYTDQRGQNWVIVNPDLLKEPLPEFKAMHARGDAYAAFGVHEESSDIAKKLVRRAYESKVNVIIDGTGDSGPGKDGELGNFLKKIKEAKDYGYTTRVEMVDLPTNIAIERMVKRGDDPGTDHGRYIATSLLKEMHSGAAARHRDWRDSSLVDSWQVWTGNVPYGQPNRVVAYGGGKGTSRTVTDLYEYNRILAKGKGAT